MVLGNRLFYAVLTGLIIVTVPAVQLISSSDSSKRPAYTRIALCLHGKFNSTTDASSNGFDGYEYIRRHILDKGKVDVYIHTWDIDSKEIIQTLYKPLDAVFENQIDFLPRIQSDANLYKLYRSRLERLPNRPPQHVLSHFYSVSKAVELAYKSKRAYDVIIKARFDLGRINRASSGPGLHNPFPVQCINLSLPIQPDHLYMANWQLFDTGPADMWFYGSPSVMQAFIHLYKQYEQELHANSTFHRHAKTIENRDDDLFNPIIFYKWWMLQNGLWSHRIALNSSWE
jgi:hypothetical protein